MIKCDCGNEVKEDECWDPGIRIKLLLLTTFDSL